MPELLDDVDDKLPATLMATAFSDNVVVGIPLRGMLAEEGDLGTAFLNVARFQLSMILQGYALRGGIAVGPVYIDEQMAWGSGLIAAYEAEQRLAREPRVVLTPEALKLMLEHVSYYSDVAETPHAHEVLIDWDGQPFVNYLDAASSDESYGPDTEILAKHRDVVVAGLELHAGDPRVRPKYVWLENYHNHFCKEHNFKSLSIAHKHIDRTYKRLHEVYTTGRVEERLGRD